MAGDEELIDSEEEGERLNWPAIIIAAVLILAVIGGAVWYFYLRQPEAAAEGPVVPEYVPPDSLAEESIYLDLPQMLITPLDGKGRSFLILKFDVAMNDPARVRDEILLKPWKMAQAKNAIIDVYSGLTREQLLAPPVKERARQRVLEEFNRLVGWEPAPPAEGALPVVGEQPPIKALYYVTYIVQ